MIALLKIFSFVAAGLLLGNLYTGVLAGILAFLTLDSKDIISPTSSSEEDFEEEKMQERAANRTSQFKRDRGDKDHREVDLEGVNIPDQSILEPKEAVFYSLLANILIWNGTLKVSRLTFLQKFIRAQYSDHETVQAVELHIKESFSHRSNSKALAQVYSQENSEAQKVLTYRLIWKLFLIDSKVGEEEKEFLKSLTDLLGINENNYIILLAENHLSTSPLVESDGMFSVELSKSILDCQPKDLKHMVKKKFLKLCREYHPDRLKIKGIGEGFIPFANKQINILTNAMKTLEIKHFNAN